MSAAAATSASRDYGLPAADDAAAWADLSRPLTGCLQLYKPSRMSRGDRVHLRRPTLEPVIVWVHCGLHYKPAPSGSTCTAPAPGDLTPLDRVDVAFKFFPLKRDEPGSRPSFSARAFCAGPGAAVRGVDGRWVIELLAAADPGHPLRFCAASEADAKAWAAQLRMRAAPLAAVWACQMSTVGGGGIGIREADDGPADTNPLNAAAAAHHGLRRVFANDVLTGIAGMATALMQEGSYNLAVAAGPVVGVAFGALGFALRVLAAVQSTFREVVDVSTELEELQRKLRGHLLPALRDLPDDGRVDVHDLIHLLGGLVADMEVVAGELHHLVRSRRARVREAASSASRAVEVGADFRAQLSVCRRRADELVGLCQLGLMRHVAHVVGQKQQAVAAGAGATELPAASSDLPSLPPNVYNKWEHSDLPAVRLYEAAIKDNSTTCAAVGAHGMGGVGKTLSCLLAAHQVATAAAGKRRFPDGVHWVQLSADVRDADVTQRVCDLANTLSGHTVMVNELSAAARRLGAALRGKSCLLVVDDVWDHRWVAAFIRAMGKGSGSCLLFSTRQQSIADRAGISNSVLVDVHQGAAAAGVLLAHAEAGGVTHADRTDGRVQDAVSLCGGLALAMAVMGSLVLILGWAPALARVRRQRDILLSTCPGIETNYDLSLHACLSASYKALGADAGSERLWRGRFEALCVLRSKEQLPLPALAALWGGDRRQAAEIAETLRDRSLVTLRGEAADGSLCLSLHDLVVEFLASTGVMDEDQRERAHLKLVANLCARSGIDAVETSELVGVKCTSLRKMWEVRPDGFSEHALPRLLCAGGAAAREELGILLFDWRFIAWRVEMGGGTCGVYRTDCRVYFADGGGAKAEMLDGLATVVERTMTREDIPRLALLQQAAWEVMSRTWSQPAVSGGEAWASLLNYLCRTVRAYLDKPAYELYGEFRLGMPQERRVFRSRGIVVCACSIIGANGEALLIVGLEDGLIEIWEEQTGSCVAVLNGHTQDVTCLEVLDDGARGGGPRVVSGSNDGGLRVWDVDGGQCVAELKGSSTRVTCLTVVDGATDGDERRVVSGSWNGTVRVWDVDGRRCVSKLTGHASWVTCLAVAGCGVNGVGRRVVSGSDDRTVRVWDVDGGTCVAVLKGHTHCVRCLSVVGGGSNACGRRVVSGSYDGTVRVWDIDISQRLGIAMNGMARLRLVEELGGGASSSRRRVVSGFDGHTTELRNDSGVECIAVLKAGENAGEAAVTCLAVVDGGGDGVGRRVVSGSVDGSVRMWDIDGGKCCAVLKGHGAGVTCLAVVYDGANGGGRRVVSGSHDTTVRVWDADGRDCVAILQGDTSQVSFLAVVRSGTGRGDGRRVASGSLGRTVRVWDIDDCKSAAERKGHKSSVSYWAVVTGGTGSRGPRVVSGSPTEHLRVWDIHDGTCVAVLESRADSKTCLVVVDGVAGDGGRLVVSNDRNLEVWDIDCGKRVANLRSRSDSGVVTCVAVVSGGANGSGRRVVSGSQDGALRMWDIDGHRCTAMLQGHRAVVTCVAVVDGGASGDRRRVVSASFDKTVRVWDINDKTCTAMVQSDPGRVTCLAAVDDGTRSGGRLVVSGSDGGALRVWDVDGGQCVAELKDSTTEVTCLLVVDGAAGGGGRRVVSGSSDGTVRVWDVDRRRWVAELKAHTSAVTCLVAVDGGAGGAGLAGIATTVVDAVCVVVTKSGQCFLLDWDGPTLRSFPSPPSVTSVCRTSRGRIAWGTATGDVFFGLSRA